MSTEMDFVLLDPVGEAEVARPIKVSPRVADVNRKAMGLLFDGHYAAIYFWEAFEKKLRAKHNFTSLISKVKDSAGGGAPKELVDEIAAKSDVVVVGVGA
ncbi:MAG: hypothetical protein ABIH46_05015 [Chloroflexota bacterium]